jgi:SAM-dependent methyltransferase
MSTPQFSLVSYIEQALARAGQPLSPQASVLDFGCGEGSLVYEFRDRGYSAYGFDIHERVKYRSPNDRQFFSFIQNPQTDTSNHVVDKEAFCIPFPDDTFDLIVSTSVIEHVMDLPAANAEMARVCTPSGMCLHVYPSILSPIEPHIYIPLGGLIQNWPYFYFWALLGIRGDYYPSATAREMADIFLRYSRTGLKYYSRRTLHRILLRDFSEVRDITRAWQGTGSLRQLWRTWREALRAPNPVRYIAVNTPLHAVLATKKR